MYPIEIGTDPRANAMDYDLSSGILYASVVHGDGAIANFIAQIDLATGDVSNVHSTILGLDGLAVFQQANGNGTAVPEGMSTLWLALPLCGLLAVHRRIRRA